ncbi:septum formation protein [Kaistia soli DSM 19436]|uniref:Nucleoside triphosphate pyrophosphatase n=1 Tax=Kaistia soli DSM 19436 TaxID=1122133 RepID=A0A1M5CW79_9HYPH|nr:Maf family protein [Kaistia soli]SHF58995.1 septum formation protein [Kaistia soli DSM 19436]
MTRIVLASTSHARRLLLTNAGVAFESIAAPVDERALETPLIAAGASPSDIALALAEAKAHAVLVLHPDALVIGGDQVLDLDGERLVKPGNRSGAAAQIACLAGRTHVLRTAVAIAQRGEIVWRHVESATLTMRPLTARAIERYLDDAGDGIFGSVGAYHLEERGIRLFSAIEGDYFSILGLPLLPLLEALRDAGAIDGDEAPA